MRKEEVKVLALQDELKEAMKEWNKAIDDAFLDNLADTFVQ